MASVLDDIKSFDDILSKKLSQDQSQAISDAIQSIIASRRKGGGGNAPLPPEIQKDPRLKQPNQKNKQKKDNREIEFNDPDKVMKGQKGDDSDDDSEDMFDLNGDDSEDSQNNNGSKNDNKDSNSKEKSGSKSDDNEQGEDTEDSDNEDDSKDGSNSKSDKSNKSGNNKSDQNQDDDGAEGEENDKADESELKKKLFGDKKDKQDKNSSKANTDDHKVDLDQNKMTMNNINRAIKHGETILKNIENHPELNISEETKEQIKNSVEDLKKLQEESKEKLKNNENLDIEAIEQKIADALNNFSKVSKVKVDSDPEVRIKKIKKDLSDRKTRQEIESEDQDNQNRSNIRRDRRNGVIRNLDEYSKVRPIQDFEIDFYNSIRDQIQMYEEELRSLSAMDPQAEDEDIISPGEIKSDMMRFEKPVVYVYIDCSGSWGPYQEQAAKLTASIKEFVDKGLCDVVPHWFKNGYIYDNPVSCGGGSKGFNQMIDQLASSNANNVIFVSDTDSESYARQRSDVLYIPGEVWWVWSNQYGRCTTCQKRLIGEISGPDPTEYALT